VLATYPAQYAVWIWSVWYVATPRADRLPARGFAVTVGIVTGVGINAAHELGHKRESLEHWASKIALAPTLYGHFFVEHNWGHHKRVSTPEDPASSRLGESFYRFWPRTVFGSLRSAWNLEATRLRRKGQRVLSPGNRVLHAWSLSVLLWGTVLTLGGLELLPFLLVQAVVGFTLLEAVNYVEHYGLLRQKDAAGRYERVRPRHSWNNNHVVTNLLLYQLQRHSDHHENPARRFVALRHLDEAPQLPAGYAAMILVALVPPAWRARHGPPGCWRTTRAGSSWPTAAPAARSTRAPWTRRRRLAPERTRLTPPGRGCRRRQHPQHVAANLGRRRASLWQRPSAPEG
jgi:alkane 1-monooxygenase